MGVQTTYLQMYLPADNELFDEQLNTNTSLQKVDAGVLVEHNGWTAHAAAPSPHTGHAVFTANTFTGQQTVQVAADAPALVYDAGVLAAAGVQTGERVIYRAHSFDAVDHHRDFMWRARTTSNAGNGVLELLTLLDAQAPPTVLQTIDQDGNVVSVGGTTSTSATITGSGVTYSGVGARVSGDMSTSTFANRLLFVTSVVNGTTDLGVTPNGTNTTASITCWGVPNPANAAYAQMQLGSASMSIISGVVGTGTYLPMLFYSGGSERMRLTTAGQLWIGTTSSPGNTVAIVGNLVVQYGSANTDATYTVRRSNGDRSFVIDGSGAVYVNPDAVNFATGGATGSTLYVNGAGNHYAAFIHGYNVGGGSYGLLVQAGTSGGGLDGPVAFQRYDGTSLLSLNSYGNMALPLGSLGIQVAAAYPLHVGGYAQINQGLGLYGQAPTAGYPLAFVASNPVVPLVYINTAGISGGMVIYGQAYGGDPHSNFLQFTTNNGSGTLVNTLWLNGYGHVSIGGSMPPITYETWLNLPAQIGDQFFVYPGAASSNYGLGINSGELVLFCGGGQTIGLRNGGYSQTRGIVFSPNAGTATFNGAVTQNASWSALKDNRAPVPDDSIDRAMAWVRESLEPVRFRLKANRYDPPTSHPVHGESPAFGHDYENGYEHVGFTMDDMPDEIRKMITANDTGGICLGDMDGFLLMLVRRLAQQVQNLERRLQAA